MFTGIVEATGRIAALQNKGGDLAVTIYTDTLDFSDVKLGDSIATNGVCLTVVSLQQNTFSADVSKETLELTGFAHYKMGQKVNLEKALTPSSRLGGHLVSGHIDGIAKIVAVEQNARATDYWLSAPSQLLKYIPYKGSVCIDGISLTVNAAPDEETNNRFKLTIVPHTAEQTRIADFEVGTSVNLEVDQLARYLERLILAPKTEHNAPKSASDNVSLDLLAQAGFIK